MQLASYGGISRHILDMLVDGRPLGEREMLKEPICRCGLSFGLGEMK